MAVTIHPTAIVGDNARLGEGCVVGPFTVIEPGALLSDNNDIGAGCHIYASVSIGHGNRLMRGACLGGEPQSFGDRGESTRLVIGDGNWFGEYVTIHRGTRDTGQTIIGDRNYFMAYSHVGHDCRLGDQIILANGVNLAGHVQIKDRANLGGGAAVHQFARVGELAMVGGLARVSQDVLPFTVMARDNALYGLNRVGIRRSAYPAAAVPGLKSAYRRFCVYREPLGDFLLWLRQQLPNPFLQVWADFFASGSQRGYARAERNRGSRQDPAAHPG
ncbi:MAG: acyl-ACP--UDP-N-acetylglucosamine O-acyltransferase [Gammaproteobacteria bacterium]